MNFQEFQTYRSLQLGANSSLIDLGETNLWRSLSDLVPILATHADVRVHRCHLAQEWVATFGLPDDWSKRALISSGVRHSLSQILQILASESVNLQIPEGVYPVYGQLAGTAGLKCQTFPTLPSLQIPENGDYLLLANPLKPAGRWLTEHEVSCVRNWLEADTRRRLLLDTVYTFDTRWHSTTRSLLESGQTILLHSLSKGWLHPQVFGVALVPDSDVERFTPTFRKNSPSQEKLSMARQLMRSHSECPQAVSAALSIRREKTLKVLSNDIRSAILLPPSSESAGYLMTVQARHTDLLSKHGLLSIPLTVFGSSREDCSVLSTLGLR